MGFGDGADGGISHNNSSGHLYLADTAAVSTISVIPAARDNGSQSRSGKGEERESGLHFDN